MRLALAPRTVLLATAMLLTAAPASAWISRSLTVEAIGGATVSAVATIVDVKPGKRGRRGDQLDALRVTARVELAIRGAKHGQTLRFTHWRAKGGALRGLNGPYYPKLVKGQRYLLALQLHGKTLQLAAPEDAPIEISPRALRGALKQHVGPPLHKALALLRLQVLFCEKSCGKAIWLLARAPTARRLPKAKMIALLLPVTRSKTTDANSKLAAYSVLGKLGETSVIPRIVAYCGGTVGRSDTRANAVSWLQGFDKAQQIAGLKAILRQTNDPSVRRSASYRLSHLRVVR